MEALVITPTTGSPELISAIKSVQNQTYKHVDHLIVVDGFQFSEKTNQLLANENIHIDNDKLVKIDIPYNTGGGGFYGHRIMSAFGHLTNHDYILFLDQDNWYENNHVESLINEIEQYNLDWAYSLRKIHDKDDNYLCDDNCESLGRWSTWVEAQSYLIDTSSYCFKTSFYRTVCHMWDYGWGADRRFYSLLKSYLKHQNYECNNMHTLCYRLGGNENSVHHNFFIDGNKKMIEKYNGNLPWLKKYS